MGQPKILSPAATAQENHDHCLPEPGVKVYGKRVIYNAASRRPPHKESPMIGVYAGVSVKPEHV